MFDLVQLRLMSCDVAQLQPIARMRHCPLLGSERRVRSSQCSRLRAGARSPVIVRARRARKVHGWVRGHDTRPRARKGMCAARGLDPGRTPERSGTPAAAQPLAGRSPWPS